MLKLCFVDEGPFEACEVHTGIVESLPRSSVALSSKKIALVARGAQVGCSGTLALGHPSLLR